MCQKSWFTSGYPTFIIPGYQEKGTTKDIYVVFNNGSLWQTRQWYTYAVVGKPDVKPFSFSSSFWQDQF